MRIFTLVIVGIFLLFFFSLYPPCHDKILNIQNYLITVGGIISAFLITYLSSKIFNIKSERETRQLELDKLSIQLTAFRQLMYFIMKSFDFWLEYDDIRTYKKKYGLSFQQLRDMIDGEKTEIDEKRHQFYEDDSLSISTVQLYTAMEAIYGDIKKERFVLAFDMLTIIRYTSENLDQYNMPSNHIWYVFDHKLHDHKHLFKEGGIWAGYEEYIKDLLPKINEKYEAKSLTFNTLASAGSFIHEFVLPKMNELIVENTGVPTGLKRTFVNLIVIMTFGVTLPLALMSVGVDNSIDTIATLIFVAITILALINFLFEFWNLFVDEIHTNR